MASHSLLSFCHLLLAIEVPDATTRIRPHGHIRDRERGVVAVRSAYTFFTIDWMPDWLKPAQRQDMARENGRLCSITSDSGHLGRR